MQAKANNDQKQIASSLWQALILNNYTKSLHQKCGLRKENISIYVASSHTLNKKAPEGDLALKSDVLLNRYQKYGVTASKALRMPCRLAQMAITLRVPHCPRELATTGPVGH